MHGRPGRRILDVGSGIFRNDAQVLVAFGDNFEAKKGLIQSTELSSTRLVAICTNPRPLALENSEVQEWFRNAVAQTELTAEQEVEIDEATHTHLCEYMRFLFISLFRCLVGLSFFWGKKILRRWRWES